MKQNLCVKNAGWSALPLAVGLLLGLPAVAAVVALSLIHI